MSRSLKKPIVLSLLVSGVALLAGTTVLATAQPADSSGPVERWRALAHERLGDRAVQNSFEELVALSERIERAEQRTHERAAEILDSEEYDRYAIDLQGLDPTVGPAGSVGEYNEIEIAALNKLNAAYIEALDDAGILQDLDTLMRSKNRLLPETEPSATLIDTLLPYLSSMRSVGRLQALRITTALEAGETKEAIECFRDGLRLLDACHVNPTLIDQLVAASLTAIFSRTISAIDPSTTTISASEFQQFEDLLKSPELGMDLTYAMQGERLFMEQMLDLTHTESGRFLPGELQRYVSYGEDQIDSSEIRKSLLNATGIAFPTREQTEAQLKELHALIDSAITQQDPAQRFELYEDFDLKIESLSSMYAAIKMLMPAIARAAESGFRAEDARKRALVNLAAIRYRSVEGELPENTDTLIATGLVTADSAYSPSTGFIIKANEVHPDDQPELRRN